MNNEERLVLKVVYAMITLFTTKKDKNKMSNMNKAGHRKISKTTTYLTCNKITALSLINNYCHWWHQPGTVLYLYEVL